MMRGKKFLSFVKRAFNDLKNDSRYTYRLIEVVEKDNIKFAHIGLRHSHMTFKEPVQKAVWDEGLIEGLSPQDIRILSMYSLFCSLQPSHEYYGCEYHKNSELVFLLRNKQTNEIVRKSHKELELDNQYIKHISNDEAYQVGKLCGSKHQLKSQKSSEQQRK